MPGGRRERHDSVRLAATPHRRADEGACQATFMHLGARAQAVGDPQPVAGGTVFPVTYKKVR